MLLARILIVQQPLDLAAFDDMLRDDLLGIFGLYPHVEGILGEDLYDRALLAKAKTPGLDDLDIVGYALGPAFSHQGIVNRRRFARFAGSSAANQDVVPECHYLPPSLMISADGRSNT
ncbi:hypothetical protein SDC9_210868 [bioreactor metagenome]|uniref:Uncharacterized protein n=1 Tax=bioreactor metagenome TaxID=1076179 RepID=A0A645JSS1_9ZZZZ